MNDDITKILTIILCIILGLLALGLGSVVIRQGADIIADIGSHIMRLFRTADLRPSHGRGFGCFIELIAIAIFVGWAINRFRRK